MSATNWMQSNLSTGAITMTWPRNATKRDLLCAKELVNKQLDIFIRLAEKEEAAVTEYASWFPPFDAEYGPSHDAP